MSKKLKGEVNWDKIEAVQRMQDYIREHALDEVLDLTKMYLHIGYSGRHANRIFKELLNKTPEEYVKAIRLSNSAENLLEAIDKSVLEIALETNYDSHEGYSKAFKSQFGIAPSTYRRKPIAIPLFIQYPVRSYYTYMYKKEDRKMNNNALLCMVTAVSRPKRKLMLLRSTKGHDYWSFCEEMGCDWEGLFNSIPEKFDTAAILELPDFLLKEGTTRVAAGVEVPDNYSGKIPNNCELVELNACDMLYFQSEPFDNGENFGAAIDTVFKAIDKYDTSFYGVEYAFELAPKFNFGASTQMGAKQALPIKKKDY
ncbi:MAG: helix-turn-helix domain-containing protein [Mobilitalea sp.]